jgi:hypothetical protein
MRRGALLAPGPPARAFLPFVPVAILILLAGPAAAQEAPQVEATMAPPEPARPGQTVDGTLRVTHCYRTSSAVPAQVSISVDSAPAWLTATPEPARYSATTGGQRCGTKDVAIHLAFSRNAPAFELGFLRLRVRGEGTSSTSTTVEVAQQATYWAELEVQAPPRIQVARGDQGTLRLPITIAANAGTRLEVTDASPDGKVTLQGSQPSTDAGAGLDEKRQFTAPLIITVSPGAALGLQDVDIRVTTAHFQRGDILGEEKTVTGQIEVLAGASANPAPGFEAGALLLAGIAGVLLLQRRGRGV